MLMEGARVIPDSRKGLVRIGRGDEGLVHLQWLDISVNIVEDDQIVFPDEAVFEKVNQSSGRVYVLKFRTNDRKFFFWMQEPKADNDTQLCNSVNFYLNQPLVKGEHLSEVRGRNPAIGQGEDSGSVKPFDFLGGQDGSRDWMDRATLSTEDNKWNAGGSTERTSWSTVPSSDLYPSNLVLVILQMMMLRKFDNRKYSREEIDEVRVEWANCLLEVI